jgi:carboxyl-terminal processing protease
MMLSRRSQRPRIAALVAAGLLVLVVGIWLGGHPGWIPSSVRGAFVDQSGGQILNEELNIIARDYYRPVNRNQLLSKGMAAVVASLNDPYSHYYDPPAYRSFLNQTNPHLSGIGIDVVPDPRGLRVIDVFPGSPAAKAGLAHGDVIVKVGSTSLAGRSSAFASNLIKGKAGTRVLLTIVRGRRTLVIPVVRANLVVPVASGSLVAYHGTKIGNLRLTAFTDGSGAELRRNVDRVLHRGAKALILDLRDNGGGLLQEAVNVASIFIPDGTIVSTAGRSQPRQVYLAKGGAIPTRIPLVVLVNRDTASSAEIVTGALKDWGRALVVGTRTYGKGVFQEIEPMSNGGALDITVGEYFTPNGQNLGAGGGSASSSEVLQGQGIKPNVYAATSNPNAPVDHALQVAERVVAAEVR